MSHGEPTLRGVEVYRDGLLLYGLGNFIFQSRTDPGRYPPETRQSVLHPTVGPRDAREGDACRPGDVTR